MPPARSRFVPPPARPVVTPLPRRRRRFLFLSLLFLFVCAVPVFVFYASGYRYDFFAEDASITATGGLYVSVTAENGELFLNNTLVQDSRVFRDALYIQGLLPGLQRLHVQAPGYHTWVKELPVYPHIVTEASAFLMPLIPQVRLITEYQTATGSPVVRLATTTDALPLAFASATVPMTATTARATSSLVRNSEYTVVRELFGTTTATATTPLINRVVDGARDILQGQGTTTATTTATSTSATSTITSRDTTAFLREDEIVVRYTGSERNIPYYFCIPDEIIASTSERFTAHVLAARAAIANELLSDELETTTTAERQCRREIVMDTAGAVIRSFNFFPDSTDLLIIHREDGVYVTEVDDRSWQNSQLVYPRTADAVVVDNNQIFIKDEGLFFELLTEIPTVN